MMDTLPADLPRCPPTLSLVEFASFLVLHTKKELRVLGVRVDNPCPAKTAFTSAVRNLIELPAARHAARNPTAREKGSQRCAERYPG